MFGDTITERLNNILGPVYDGDDEQFRGDQFQLQKIQFAQGVQQAIRRSVTIRSRHFHRAGGPRISFARANPFHSTADTPEILVQWGRDRNQAKKIVNRNAFLDAVRSIKRNGFVVSSSKSITIIRPSDPTSSTSKAET